MNIRILVLSVLWLNVTAEALPQKISLSPFARAQAGYGVFRGYTDPNYNFFTAGNSVEESTYRIFDGTDYSFAAGVSLHRPGSDYYRESSFDVYMVHKRISGFKNRASFSGAGLRVRYQFFYGGVLLGIPGNRNEIPVELDSLNNPLNYGNLHGMTPMFNVGFRIPLNSGHTLFLEIPIDFVIPRNRLDDQPVESAALFEWYSFGLGLCYHLPAFDLGSE